MIKSYQEGPNIDDSIADAELEMMMTEEAGEEELLEDDEITNTWGQDFQWFFSAQCSKLFNGFYQPPFFTIILVKSVKRMYDHISFHQATLIGMMFM